MKQHYHENDFWAPGEWNVACSMCGRKLKASQAVKNWQGMWRCPDHNEPRQPQDFVRGIPDIMTPPFVQTKGDPIYVEPTNFATETGENISVATTTAYDSILNIYEGVTVPTLTVTGSGTLVVNNWGIVEVLVNASATIELNNFGRWL